MDSRFGTVALILTIKMVWQNGLFEQCRIWHGQCCYTRLHIGKQVSTVRCGQWLSRTRYIFKITRPAQRICVPWIYLRGAPCPVIGFETFTHGDALYIFWTLHYKLAKNTALGTSVSKGCICGVKYYSFKRSPSGSSQSGDWECNSTVSCGF